MANALRCERLAEHLHDRILRLSLVVRYGLHVCVRCDLE
jgi:hypothetical protein